MKHQGDVHIWINIGLIRIKLRAVKIWVRYNAIAIHTTLTATSTF